MLREYKIIDADSHVYEPFEMWQVYLEPEFKDAALSPDLKIQGETIVHKLSNAVNQAGIKQVIQAHPMSVLNRFNPDSHVRAMEDMGVDVCFIYPTYGLWIIGMDVLPARLIGAFTRAYNNWLHDFCRYNSRVLQGVGLINPHAPEEMVPELQRIAEFGWKAVMLRPNPVKGRLLSDPVYDPFWLKCEELGIAVAIHEGTHSRSPTTGSDRFQTRFAMHACSHPMEQMMALLALIEGGVLERHPRLKVGFLEAGCGWLPYWLWRLDEEYRNLQWEVKDTIKMNPSEYFRRQCYVSIEPSEPYLAQVIQTIGVENLLFGSDYPHMDHKPTIVEEVVALEDHLSKDIVQTLLWDNAARFYGWG